MSTPSLLDDHVAWARSRFPRGLYQPQNGFRFSVDSLLLTSFAHAPQKGGTILDIGAGSGVIAMGMLLEHESAMATGLELSPDMAKHARNNAARLGLEGRFTLVEGNAVEARSLLEAESFDLVVSNPPFRAVGSGRSCPDDGKQSARFETNGGLAAFVSAAAFAVRNKGRVNFVFLADRLNELLSLFTAAKLEPKRLRFIHGRLNDPARIVLIEARKNGKPGLCIESPLVLYEDGPGNVLRDEVVEYCPYLGTKWEDS